jgi:arylsulfatase
MYGHRGIWHEGWKAVTNHEPGTSFDDEKWELYHLDADFAETRDLATERPAKLRELVERWWGEAGKYDVMPLDDRREILFRPLPNPHAIRAMRRFVFRPPLTRVPAECAPMFQDTSHRFDVRLECGGNGVLLAFGSAFGGFAFFIQNGRPVYVYNACGTLTYVEAAAVVPAGAATVSFAFAKDAPLAGSARIEIDGTIVAAGRIEGTLVRTSLAPFTIGRGTLPPVCERIDGSAPFNGTIREVACEVDDDGEHPVASLDID